MNIVVYGAGYIGCVNANCLSSNHDHDVTLVEVDKNKLKQMDEAQPLFYEKDFDWDSFYQRVKVTSQVQVDPVDVAVVCINCEVTSDGYNISGLYSIIDSLKDTNTDIFIRSTVGPQEISAIKARSASRKITYWPEFLREGSALADFRSDKDYFGVIGQSSEQTIRKIESITNDYAMMKSAETLSMVKTYSNFYRALKVSFGNSVGQILNRKNLDESEFYDVFLSLRGNCDHLYLRPGDPFGGFCLPKETAYVASQFSTIFGNESNLAKCALSLNDEMIDKAVEKILNSNVKSLGVLHFPFKKGTSDLRDSPTMKVATILSRHIMVYDLDGSSAGNFAEAKLADVDAVFLNQNCNPEEYKAVQVFGFADLGTDDSSFAVQAELVEKSAEIA